MTDTIQLGSLRDGRLRVREPFRVLVTERELLAGESPCVFLEATEITEFGWGDTRPEAIADLQHTIAGLYFSLKPRIDRLAPCMLAIWETLQRKLEEMQ